MVDPTTATPISTGAVVKALAVLVEELTLRTEGCISANQTTSEPIPLSDPLENKIQTLESCLSAFSYHVRHELARLRRQKNALAPIHRLPVELSKYIFLLQATGLFSSRTNTEVIHKENIITARPRAKLAPRGKVPKKISSDTVYSAVVKMASVSSYWYQLAVSTPQLWSYLDSRHHLDVIKALLGRSMPTPLHISCSADVNWKHEQKFMDLVTPHMDRWKSFDSFHKGSILFRDIETKDYSAPLLEKLIFHNDGSYCYSDEQLPSLILERSPRLRDLHIVKLGHPLGAKVLSGLSNLTVWSKVGDNSFTMQNYELLFSSSPKLETIFISSGGHDPGGTFLFSAKLPYLRSITLHGLNPVITRALLLSIFPEPSQHPVAKVLGQWGAKSSGVTSEPPRVGSLLQQIISSITWMSISGDFTEVLVVPHVFLTGKIANGIRVPLLEINDVKRGQMEDVFMELIQRDGTCMLKSIELQLQVLGSSRHLAKWLPHLPHLEHLLIAISADQLHMLVEIMEPFLLQPLDAKIWWAGLKVLSFKGLKDLQPLMGLIEARYGPSQEGLLSFSFLRQLRIIEIQCSKWPLSKQDEEIERQLKLHLVKWKIELDIVPIHNQVYCDMI